MKHFGLTNIGKVRSQNQDYFLCIQSPNEGWSLVVVCDGMGGAKSGNIASELCCRVFIEVFTGGYASTLDTQNIAALMLRALEAANTAVYNMSVSDYECRGMGTTIVAAYVKGDLCLVLNVGDSRAYLLSESSVHMVTHDHSYVQRLVDAGELTQEEAKHHNKRNVITRAVGTSPTVRGDVYNPALLDGFRLLICTDGITNTVSDDELLSTTRGKNPEDACRALIELYLSRGASDNGTVVIYEK